MDDTPKRKRGFSDFLTPVLIVAIVAILSGTIYLVVSTSEVADTLTPLSVRVNTDRQTAATTEVTAIVSSEGEELFQKTFGCNTTEAIGILEKGTYEMLVLIETEGTEYSLGLRESGITASSSTTDGLIFEYEYVKE